MNTSTVMMPVRTLRERMAEDMDLRRLSRATQRNYLRDVTRFAMWLGRPPDTASGEELRQFQLDQREAGLGGPTLNSIVSALRFFYTHTIDRPDLTLPGQANVYVIGDTALVTQGGKQLPGVAPVAMQEGRYVGSIIAEKATGQARTRPFHYVDKGTLVTVGRGFGVVNIGLLRFTGALAWFVWLFVHLLFLIGVPNRLMVFLQYIWWYLTYQKQERIILPEGSLPPV